jgi:hypothetical protein
MSDPRRWIDRAVNATAEFLETNYPAALRALELREGLVPNSLQDPEAYVRRAAPFDARAPLVEVYDDGWEFLDQGHVNTMCAVGVWVYVSYLGDADVEAGNAMVNKYITALLDLVQARFDLDGAVASAIMRGGRSEAANGDNERTRHSKGQLLEIHVYEPGVA